MLTKKDKKNYISSNLEYLINEFRVDIKNISLATGVPPASISRLKREGADANPTLSTLEPLLNFFRIDMESFLYEDLSSVSSKNNKTTNSKVVKIYKLEDLENKKFEYSVITASDVSNQNVFGIIISSDNLQPVFQKNTILILDPDLEPNEGDFVLCKLDGDTIPVFRKIFFNGKKVIFKTLGESFESMAEHRLYEILGVIIKSIGTFR